MTTLRQQIRDRLDTVPGEHRPRPMPAGIAAIVLLTLFIIMGFTFKVPLVSHEGGRLVRAEVATADAITHRTPVRVHGVDVGRVDRVEPAPSGRTAIVVMRITDDSVGLHSDARVRVAWRTLLGQVYVELDPGSPSAAALGDRVIPLERNGIQADWDDFNSQFDAKTRPAQQRLFAALRRALTAPAAHGRTLRTLGPSLAVIGRGAGALRGNQAGDLRRLVQTTARTLDALSRDDVALERLVDAGNRTLAATAHRRRALGEATELAPAALRSTSVTMRRLLPTLDRLDPLVEQLRPGARRLGHATKTLAPTLAETDRVLLHARPLLAAAPPALAALGAAARQGTPLIKGLAPTVRRLDSELLPYLNRRDDATRLRVYEGIGPFFAALASAAGEFDAAGHWLNFPHVGGPDSLVTVPCDTGLTLGPDALKRCDVVNEVLKLVFGGPAK